MKSIYCNHLNVQKQCPVAQDPAAIRRMEPEHTRYGPEAN